MTIFVESVDLSTLGAGIERYHSTRRRGVVGMSFCAGTRFDLFSFYFLFSYTFVFTHFSLSLSLYCFLRFPASFLFVTISLFSHFNMSRNAYNASSDPEVPSSPVGESSDAADTNAACDIQATDINIDRCVPCWSVVEYKTGYAEMLDARRFGVMFSDGCNGFMVERRNVPRHTDIATLNKRLRFCGGGALDRCRTLFGLISRQFAKWKKLRVFVDCYASCGMLKLRWSGWMT